MMKVDSATWCIAVALIVYGLLAQYGSLSTGWNWVVAGVVGFIVAWLGAGMKK